MFELKKQEGKDFVILNLADVQLGNDEWNPEHKNRKIATYTIDTLIKRVKPDLITLSGDQGWAGQIESYINLGELIDGYNIPWTFVWGNHDQQNGYDFIDKVVDEYSKLQNLIYEHGPSELGRGNFVIKVTENERPISALILMDTHDRLPYTAPNGEVKNEWAKLYPEQFVWYENQINELESLGYHDTTILTHIPIFAYKTVAEKAFKSGLDLNAISISDSYTDTVWNEGYKDSFGVQHELIDCYPVDDNFFELIKKLGSTKSYVCGHDHVSCTSITHEGVRLTFALKTGAGCYWEREMNGGTVIRITENGATTPKHEFVDVSALV